jgi:hypothetical protein
LSHQKSNSSVLRVVSYLEVPGIWVFIVSCKGITAAINGSIIMSAGVGGTFDSGKIPIVQVGVPGLDFQGYVLYTDSN